MNATQRRESNREKQTEKSNLHRWFGTPLWVVARSWQRTPEFQELTTSFNNHIHELQNRVQRRLERLLGLPVPKRRRRRLYQVLGIEQLEARMLLTATWGASDGVVTLQDADGDTQAINVTTGDIEIHCDDDVADSGNVTEVRLRSNTTGFHEMRVTLPTRGNALETQDDFQIIIDLPVQEILFFPSDLIFSNSGPSRPGGSW